MSALRTPTLPRRDTLRAHPQPRAALLRHAEGGVCIHQTESASKQRSPNILGHGCTHRRVPNRRHSQQQSHISHTCQSNTDKTVDRRLLLPPQTQSRSDCVPQWPNSHASNQTCNYYIRTFESTNHSFIHTNINQSFIHSYIHHTHSFIAFEHSTQSLITLIQSFIIQSGTTGGRGEVC